MKLKRSWRAIGTGLLGVCFSLISTHTAGAQVPRTPPSTSAANVVTIEPPDAQRTREELAQLLQRYPPSVRGVLALDPSLLVNQTYLAPYPGLVRYLNVHPEVVRNPAFYIGTDNSGFRVPRDHAEQVMEIWREVMNGIAIFAGFAMAIGLLVWLIRTLVDYRRWNRLAKVQTEVHTKLLDRFTANNELLAYIQSPAGANFLQSSPIKLDPAPRSISAPLGRILWSIQGGVVLIAGGIGLQVVSSRVTDDAAQPLQALGILGLALGLGFIVSALLSFLISHRLGLIDTSAAGARNDLPQARGFETRE